LRNTVVWRDGSCAECMAAMMKLLQRGCEVGRSLQKRFTAKRPWVPGPWDNLNQVQQLLAAWVERNPVQRWTRRCY
jgi:hypothetical protein